MDLTIGNVYKLNGVSYRLLNVLDTGIHWFQELNSDGSDYHGYDTQGIHIQDPGRRIIYDRLNELLPEGIQLKLF